MFEWLKRPRAPAVVESLPEEKTSKSEKLLSDSRKKLSERTKARQDKQMVRYKQALNAAYGAISATSAQPTWSSAPIMVDPARNDGGVFTVYGRDILNELDNINAALLIVSRDIDLEEKYPELKEAYDNYMEIKRGLGIAEKLYSTGVPDV